EDVRRAVREQLRYGADFIKVMTTGARSVELEDPDPAQLTPEELAVVVEEAHRMGYRVCAHCEGLAGTELAIEAGVDTIEHGMYPLLRMTEPGLTPRDALVAATAGGAYALGLADHVGTVEPGKLADLVVVDGDPVAEPELLCDGDRIWLVLRVGTPVAGTALE